MYSLWNSEFSFPKSENMKKIKNAKYIDVHTAIHGEYQFLLGAAIIKHKDIFYASWGNSFRNENDDNTILAQKISKDGGISWNDYRRISDKEEGYGRSHGVYFSHEGKLYVFCAKAKFDKIDAYPDLKTEAYMLNEDGSFSCLGIVLDEYFWPMCEPLILDDGTILMAGLKTDTAEAAIALCTDNDITKWEMKVIPNPNGFEYWGETTVLKKKDKLVAIVRGGDKVEYALVSESYDGGKSWSGLTQSNLPISNSKLYAGTLSNGKNYLVFNSKTEKYREALCIAIGNDVFDEVYLIKEGFDSLPKYWSLNEWCYPYAYEADGNLYVIYAKNKEDCELAIIPIENF